MLQQVPDLNFRQNFDDEYHDEKPELFHNEIENHNEPRQFRDGPAQRRGIVLNDTNPFRMEQKAAQRPSDLRAASFFAHHDHMLNGAQGYDRDLCAELRVPCRFVNDHPCCNFEMPLDLVARSRALDGSADLKWRPVSLGGPRNAAQGRSLFRSLWISTLPPTVVNKKIKYNFAKSKKTVKIPQYHYDGGPEMTSTIVGLCWRLHYIQCPPTNTGDVQNVGNKSQKSNWIDAQKLKQIHPCCQILRRPSHGSSALASRVSRWLHHSPSLV